MREFVSGPPSYRSIYKRIRDRKPSLGEGSRAVCGFRTQFFEKRHFLGARSHLSSECLKRSHRLLIKHDMHMLLVYGHRRWQRLCYTATHFYFGQRFGNFSTSRRLLCRVAAWQFHQRAFRASDCHLMLPLALAPTYIYICTHIYIRI